MSTLGLVSNHLESEIRAFSLRPDWYHIVGPLMCAAGCILKAAQSVGVVTPFDPTDEAMVTRNVSTFASSMRRIGELLADDQLLTGEAAIDTGADLFTDTKWSRKCGDYGYAHEMIREALQHIAVACAEAREFTVAADIRLALKTNDAALDDYEAEPRNCEF